MRGLVPYLFPLVCILPCHSCYSFPTFGSTHIPSHGNTHDAWQTVQSPWRVHSTLLLSLFLLFSSLSLSRMPSSLPRLLFRFSQPLASHFIYSLLPFSAPMRNWSSLAAALVSASLFVASYLDSTFFYRTIRYMPFLAVNMFLSNNPPYICSLNYLFNKQLSQIMSLVWPLLLIICLMINQFQTMSYVIHSTSLWQTPTVSPTLSKPLLIVPLLIILNSYLTSRLFAVM